MAEAGKDATEAFEDVGHSDEARAMLADMLVGDFEGSVGVNTSSIRFLLLFANSTPYFSESCAVKYIIEYIGACISSQLDQ